MWEVFLDGQKKTKEILFVMFGCYSETDHTSVSKFKNNGMEEIMVKYPEYAIQEAQKKLREITSEQLSSIKVDKHLLKRRMKDKENFKLYLRGFCQELFRAPLKQRLCKSTAKSIAKVIETDQYYSFF